VKEVAVANLLQSSYSIASVILFSFHINFLVEIPIVTVTEGGGGVEEKKGHIKRTEAI
jgi:hypothetical protein